MKRDVVAAIIGIALIAGICYGLNAVRPNLPPRESHPFSTAPAAHAPGAVKAPAGETVVMHVNGEPVTEREFMMYLQSAPQEMQQFYASPQGRQLLAQEIVKVKALAQEAERLGVTNDAETSVRLNVDRSNILAGMALRKLVQRPTEARIQAEYAKEKPNLDTIELSHLLIAYQGSQIPARNRRPLPLPAAMKRAKEIAARLKAGADFAATVKAESDDAQTAVNGGLLGPVNPAALPPELASVATKLKPGEISDPVQSQFGIHIFKAGEHRTAPLQDQIRDALAQRIQRNDANSAAERLQKAAKVDLDPKFFKR